MQVILFINRRGTATGVRCKDCGNLTLCKSCQVPIIYHKENERLVCHHCNRKYKVPTACSNCNGTSLKFTGTGTEKVESLVKQTLVENFHTSKYGSLTSKPKVRRFDSDSIRTKKDFENFYEEFKRKEFDILVGTQMLAKGWDLSSVGLIGVINADTTLQFPDFRSNERTFQLVTQVAGRTGRGQLPGKVVVQTYNPENFALQAALKHDYRKFFEQEIEDRKEYNYPPFSQLIKLTIKHFNKERVLARAQEVFNDLNKNESKSVEIIGPSPAFIPRIRGRYIYHVIIKISGSEFPQEIKKKLKSLTPDWDIDVDPVTLL